MHSCRGGCTFKEDGLVQAVIGFPADNLVTQVNSLAAAIGTLAVRKRQAQLVVRARDTAAAIEIWEAGRKSMKVLLEMTSGKGASS